MSLGRYGEELAANLLLQNNYIILERNFRTKIGEIDIIAYKDSTLVFCEVKTRKDCSFGHPIEAVTPRKQKTIKLIAKQYLANLKASHSEIYSCNQIRFDVITLIRSNLNDIKIEHFKNAF